MATDGDAGTVRLLKETGPGQFAVEGPFQFSPDGSALLVGGGGVTSVWDVDTAAFAPPFAIPDGLAVSQAEFSPSGTMVVALCRRRGNSGSAVYLFETATGRMRTRLPAAPRGVTVVGLGLSAFLTGCEYIYAAGYTPPHECAYCRYSALDGQWRRIRGPWTGLKPGWDLPRVFALGGVRGGRDGYSAALVLGQDRNDPSKLRYVEIRHDFPPPARKCAAPMPRDLAVAWHRLGGDDAADAWEGMLDLTRAGDAASPFLTQRLKGTAAEELDEYRRLVAELAGPPAVSELAQERLMRAGPAARGVVAAAGRSPASVEQKARLDRVASRLAGEPPRGELLRAMRAVEVLEYIATPTALKGLTALADGSSRGDTVSCRARQAATRLRSGL